MSMFGIRLKGLRMDHKERQEDIAQLLKVQRNTVAEYENGTIVPPINKIKMIADHYSVSIDYLMGNTNFQTHAERLEISPLDISKNMKVLLDNLQNSQMALTFNGVTMSPEIRNVLISYIQTGLQMGNILTQRKDLE